VRWCRVPIFASSASACGGFRGEATSSDRAWGPSAGGRHTHEGEAHGKAVAAAASHDAAALLLGGLDRASKTLESAPWLKAEARSDHEAGAIAADNLGTDFPDHGNYVAITDRSLLLLPCPDNGLHTHGGSQIRAV
jgi:hypothetical protein